MKLMICAVLLAVTQAAPPHPVQAASQPSGPRNNPQAEAKRHRASSRSPKLHEQPIPRDDPHQDTSKQSDVNTQKPIIIRESVTAPEKAKDWWDKVYVLAASALVLVGAIGAWLAWRTLNAIERQGLSMRRQTTQLRKSVVAARRTVRSMRKQAELMEQQLKEMEESRKLEAKTLILQYRPRIVVRFARAEEFNVADLGERAKGKVRFKIVNTGGSPAHISGGNIALWSAEGPRSTHTKTPTLSHGKDADLWQFTLQPGEESAWEEELDAAVTQDIQWANYHAGIKTEPLKSIYLVGTIWYRDDLNIPRQTGINRVYDPETKWFKAQDSEGEYTD